MLITRQDGVELTCVDEAGATEAGLRGLHELRREGSRMRVQGLDPGQLPKCCASLDLCHYPLVIRVQVPVAARQSKKE